MAGTVTGLTGQGRRAPAAGGRDRCGAAGPRLEAADTKDTTAARKLTAVSSRLRFAGPRVRLGRPLPALEREVFWSRPRPPSPGTGRRRTLRPFELPPGA